jgi:hypothetical protein
MAALDELLNYGLVEAKGTKGQIYNLTKYGWDAYDKIMASNLIFNKKPRYPARVFYCAIFGRCYSTSQS